MSQLEKLHNKCRHVLKKYKGYVVVCMFCDKSIDDIINQAYSLALTELEERLPEERALDPEIERLNIGFDKPLKVKDFLGRGFNFCLSEIKSIIKEMKKEIK